MRKISIILLWWARTQELEEMSQKCLESIIENTKYPEYEIIIIENQCLENVKCFPSEYLKSLKNPKISVHTQTENLGFIRGNNLGMRLAGDNDVLLINNDTLVPKGWLTPLVLTVNSQPNLAVCMPPQIHRGSHEYIDLQGDLDKVMEHMNATIENANGDPKATMMKNGNWLPLCCTIITRRAINKVGFLDEKLGLGGFDDIDYCWRCIDEGLELWLVGGSRVFHHYGQSFHFHAGLAEKWVDYGKYLIEKQDATQSTDNAIYRIKDKPEEWYRRCTHKIKPEDMLKFEALYGKAL